MMDFDFSKLVDLNLSAGEINAITKIFKKQKVNQSFWQETPQLFIENYIRCVRSALSCNGLPSVTCAQGILESGWFSTNSLFGVKATILQTEEHIGVQAQTHEVVGQLSIPTVGTFFETPSVQNNFGNLFNYLAQMKPDTIKFLPDNVAGYLGYIQSPMAYSTAGQAYINSVTEIILDNGLQVFDHV